MLEEVRRTELVPISEALLLNCEFLIGLDAQMHFSEDRKNMLEGILHENGDRLFLNQAIDSRYRFYDYDEGISFADAEVDYSGTVIKIPVEYVSEMANILVTVSDGVNRVALSDWEIIEVTRDKKDKGNYEKYVVKYESKKAKDVKFKAGMTVSVEIIPHSGVKTKTYQAEYKVEDQWIGLRYSRVK